MFFASVLLYAGYASSVMDVKLSEHVLDLARPPAVSQFLNLTVSPGSTISYHSDNHLREHFSSSAEN